MQCCFAADADAGRIFNKKAELMLKICATAVCNNPLIDV